MAASQTNNPRKLNFDKNPAFLAEDEAAYLLNHEINSVDLGHSNAMAANYPAAQIQQPGGECYDAGGFEDKITNEDYSFVYNSNGAHYLQRISGKNGVEIVYDKECLQLSADPQHKITPERAILRLDEVYNKDNQGCKNRHGKQVIWTDGLNPIGCIDTEASIATNGFTTPFFDICPDPCAMIQLCVPEICGEITGEFVPRTIESLGLSNKLLQQTFKFRIRHIYYDLRANEWSDISKPFYIDDKGCFQAIESLPRCIRLKIPIGNPMVERIEVAFSNGTIADDGVNEVWKLYATIEKYKKYNNSQQKWYERELAENILDTFNPEDCTFLYDFCNDKECSPIDPKETSRVYNPLPGQPQGILRVKENNFGFYNYKQGNCPVDKLQVEKIKITAACQQDICEPEYAIVRVRLLIVDYRNNSNQYVYRLNGTMGGEDDATDQAYYGAAPNGNLLSINKPVKDMCGQRFNKARNFTAYIEGTSYFVEMKQWTANNGFTNRVEYGIVSGMKSEELDSRIVPMGVINNGYFYQEAIFKVPKGTSGIIRVKAPSTKADDPSSSAPIAGTLPISQFNSQMFAPSNWKSIAKRHVSEIAFDTCNGDQELDDAFLVLSANGYKAIYSIAPGDADDYLYDGYITDLDNDPVADALVTDSIGTILSIADANGYYSYYAGNDTVNFQIRVEVDCADFKQTEALYPVGLLNSVSTNNVKISWPDYIARFFERVNIFVNDCFGIPVKGVVIALTSNKYKYTDAQTGMASFKVRNNYTRNKKVIGYVMDRNGCFILSCTNQCITCLPKTGEISILPCLSATGIQITQGTNDTINVDAIVQNQKGLKRGGNYPLGVVLEGDCGKLSAVYELPSLNIPKIQETLSIGRCLLSYDARGFVAPPGFNCFKIVRGENKNSYQIQWIVDKIEKTGNNKILLTIQSLNDYNELYFFETNTVYQWLKGDRVEFIRDQDGKIIDATTHGILNYLTVSPFSETLLVNRNEPNAKYFNQIVIEDDGRIDFLKEGSLIEIQRAKECLTEPVYYQVATIPILPDGTLAVPVGSFETYDTYIKKRNITGGFFQIFEHHSPSDFWGTKLSDAGKAYFVNLYENERRFGRNISINAVGQFNYFGDLVKTMPATQQGDIIAMSISDGRVILAICENDNFVAMSADDLLRVGNNGLIVGIPPDTIIGNPEAKLSGTYGCRYSDIGSIYFGDGYATWYNADNYDYVMHDYQMAKAVSAGKTQSYFRTIGTKMDLVNKTANDLDKIRFSTGFNSLTGAVIITNKSWRHSGINNDKKLYESPNSTLLFNPQSEDFLTMASFTAERYSHVILDDGFGCAFLAYFNGIPYIHPVVPDRWNEFFGVPVDRVMTLSLNKYQQKEKIPLAFELQSEMRYFVSSVETSDPNFVSEIPPVKVKQFGKKWNASFLRNINSIGGLFNGKEASDYWMKVTFVRDNTQEINGKPVYGSIDNAKRVKFDSLSLIFFRFQVSEESGFPEQQ